MKKALLLTGKKAGKIVLEQKRSLNNYYENEIEFKIKELPTEVAAFITKSMVSSIEKEDFDYIIVPGKSPFDFSNIENVYKGPKNAFNIYKYLKDNLEKLSSTKSADKVIQVESNDESELEKYREEAEEQLEIKNLSIGKDKPMKIAAEIVDSTNKSSRELKKIIKDYERQGADLIDLGIPISANKQDLVDTIRLAKKYTDLPLSIDTLDPDYIKKAIELDIDLVLSITSKNIDELIDYLKGVNCVVASKNNLNNLIRRIKKVGGNPIADPIVEPPNQGLLESIIRYHGFNEQNFNIPVFFGIGNVTEMIDADSHGVNSIMASIASELSVSILFTVNASPKTINSIKELKEASKMNYLAKNKESAPKDFSFNLLKLKEKTRKEIKPSIGEKSVIARENQGYEKDKGYFEIGLDRENEELIATFYEDNNKEPSLTIRGKSAKAASDKIKEMDLIEKEGHYLYLGRELKKAEIALKTGKNYLQDTEMF